jgi:hypothetical protein
MKKGETGTRIAIAVVVIVFLVIVIVCVTVIPSSSKKAAAKKLNASFGDIFIPPSDPIKLVFFHTEGPPNDQAKALTKQADDFISYYKNENVVPERWTPKRCMEWNSDLFTKIFKTYEGPFPYFEHYRGNMHGFWSWKPFIIDATLSQMQDGEILFYHDSNIERYPFYGSFTKPFDVFARKLLKLVNADIFVPFEKQGLLAQQHVKKYCFETIGEYNDYYRKWPLLNANRIIIRKTPFTVDLVKQWLNYCCDEKILLPEKEKEGPLMCHTHDQAILTTLTRKQIKLGKLPQDWPKVWFFEKHFDIEHMRVYNK